MADTRYSIDLTPTDRPRRRRRFVLILAGFFSGAIVLLWAWNTIAVGVFAAPPLGFRHAVAAELVIAVIVALSAGIARMGSAR